MECRACHHANRAGAKFCGICGAALVAETVCSHCGAVNLPDQSFCDTCGQSLRVTPAAAVPGPRLPATIGRGRYQVRRFLGEGARKQVYLALDTRLEREVAVAVVKTHDLDAAGRGRISREVQAMGRLGEHPHIVTIFDVDEQDNQLYLVSQYMPGGDLTGLLAAAPEHRLPIDDVLRIASQLCQALDHAHARQLVHRDLKPGNVWLSTDGDVKLGDFGLAVALDRSRLTVAGMMVGTVAYMPPEQALGQPPDARSDLYALGALLYELVTGRPPFLGDEAVAVISQHLHHPPVAPSWHNPAVPPGLESLIVQLLAKSPEQRPASARAVLDRLSTLATAGTVSGEAAVVEVVQPLDRLAEGIFVGRERETGVLRAALDDTLSGRGRVVLLVGEPGIGKTRAAEELATYARLRGAQVLWGRCYEGEGAPAYWPWIQIVRRHVRTRDLDALRQELGPGAADIAQVVSEIRERLPGLPEPPTLHAEQARFRLFESFTTFLKHAATPQPLVLVLDDLHWADKPSLLLLEFLARELAGSRLLVVGTYRDVEVRRHHPLAPTLAGLAREELSQRILLRGLTEADVARLIEATAGVTPPQGLVAAIHRETEGNAFFISEIVRLLVSEGRLTRLPEGGSWSVTIPQSVREVVGRRLDHLSPDCNQVLTIASVIGREFGLEALERVSGFEPDRVLEVLEEAEATRIIETVPRAARHYRFCHALIRETLYEELTATRRVRLHRQVGEALEAVYAGNLQPHVAELAHHFLQAARGGDADKALGYATRAGERAMGLLAYEAAVAHYERALQALDLIDPPDERRQLALLVALGDAQRRSGESRLAMETCSRAADLARSLGFPEDMARATLAFEDARWEAGLPEEVAVARLKSAVEILPDADSALRARLLARLARALSLAGPEDTARTTMSEAAIAMARRVDDPVTLAVTLHARLEAIRDYEHAEGRLDLATELLHVAETVGEQELAARGHFHRLGELLRLGDMGAAGAEIERASRLAGELRERWHLAFIATFRTMSDLLAGRFAQAEARAQTVAVEAQRLRSGGIAWNAQHQLLLAAMEQAGLQERAAELIAGLESYPAHSFPRALLCRLYTHLGRIEDARAAFECFAAEDFRSLRETPYWAPAATVIVEVCAALGDAPRAALLYERLLRFERLNLLHGPIVCYGSAARYLGLLATTLSQWDTATRHFEAALAMNARCGARAWLAHTQHDYARMLLARHQAGDRERALALLTEALETGQALGMARLTQQALAARMRAQGVPFGAVHTSIDAVATAVQADRPALQVEATSSAGGLVAVMFTDIEGYTSLTERLGDTRAQHLLRTHNRLVREQVAAYSGREVKSLGDGFMVVFADVPPALACAVALQRVFAQPGEQDPGEAVRIRIGLHCGQAIRDADDFFGRTVIVAARIANEARGGEILVSHQVKASAAAVGGVRFGPERTMALKGLSGSHAVFGVAWAEP